MRDTHSKPEVDVRDIFMKTNEPKNISEPAQKLNLENFKDYIRNAKHFSKNEFSSSETMQRESLCRRN